MKGEREELKTKFEEAFIESEEKFKSLFYNNPEALVYIDKDGTILDINKKFTELFGYTLEEIKGKNINSGIIHPKNLINEGEKLDSIALKTGYFNFETVRKKKDGTLFPVSISGSPIVVNGEVKGVIGLYIDLTEKKKKEELLRNLSTHDSLTGLGNKILLKEEFEIEKAKCKRFKNKLAIFFLDLYDFKLINDYYGHEVGDKVLKAFAEKLRSVLRDYDLIARIGGDEFVILINDINKPNNIPFIANKIINSFEEPIILDDKKFNISLNIGISIFPDDSEELEDLIKKADFAMYYAKTLGKNTFSLYNEEILQKRIEYLNNIKRSELRYEYILKFSPFGIILLDENKTSYFVNDAFLKMTKLNKIDVIGKNIYEIFLNSDIKNFEFNIEQFFKGKEKERSIEIGFNIDEREKIFLKLEFYNILNEELNEKYCFVIVQDITKERFLNHALKEKEEFLNNVMNNLQAIVVVEDLDGNIYFINRKGCEITGWTYDELIGKNWVELLTPEHYKEELKKFYEELKKGEIEKFEIHENPILTKKGEEKLILWKNSFIKTEKGEIRLLSSGLDITEYKIIRKTLKQKEEILEKLLDTIDEPITIKDLSGNYIYTNKAFNEIFLKGKSLLRKRDKDIFDQQVYEKLRELDEKVIKTDSKVTEEIEGLVDGEFSVYRVTKAPLHDENGNIFAICSFAVNLTELKKKEKEKEVILKSLKEKNDLLETIFDISEDLIYIKNLDGTYIQANKAFLNFLNKKLEEIIEKRDYDIFSKEEYERMKSIDDKILETKSKITYDE